MLIIETSTTSVNRQETPMPFISVKFSDSPYMIQVATQLRRAWITQPLLPNPPFFPSTAVEHAYIDYVFHEVLRTASQYGSDKHWAEAIRPDPQPGKINTFWHEKIAYSFNHVFADTWRFLAESRDDIGVFAPPCDQLLPVPFSAEATKPLDMEFEDNILVYPAFLAPGITLTWQMENGFRGVFDGSNKDEIWWVKFGERVKIFVEKRGYNRGDGDVAAVLVIGQLSTSDQKDEFKTAKNGGGASGKTPGDPNNRTGCDSELSKDDGQDGVGAITS